MHTISKFVILAFICFFMSCRNQSKNKFGDAKTDIKNGKIRIITYGLEVEPISNNSIRQIDSLKKHYGFYYDNQGCIIDSISSEAANEYNQVIFDYLSQKNGKNWYENYQRQVDSVKVYL